MHLVYCCFYIYIFFISFLFMCLKTFIVETFFYSHYSLALKICTHAAVCIWLSKHQKTHPDVDFCGRRP